jgi:hypothetical protein
VAQRYNSFNTILFLTFAGATIIIFYFIFTFAPSVQDQGYFLQNTLGSQRHQSFFGIFTPKIAALNSLCFVQEGQKCPTAVWTLAPIQNLSILIFKFG